MGTPWMKSKFFNNDSSWQKQHVILRWHLTFFLPGCFRRLFLKEQNAWFLLWITLENCCTQRIVRWQFFTQHLHWLISDGLFLFRSHWDGFVVVFLLLHKIPNKNHSYPLHNTENAQCSTNNWTFWTSRSVFIPLLSVQNNEQRNWTEMAVRWFCVRPKVSKISKSLIEWCSRKRGCSEMIRDNIRIGKTGKRNDLRLVRVTLLSFAERYDFFLTNSMEIQWSDRKCSSVFTGQPTITPKLLKLFASSR